MTHKSAATSTDQDLLYEDGVPVENETHATFAWDNLVLPLREWMRRVGRRAFTCSNVPVSYAKGKDALGPDVCVVNGGTHHGQDGWVPWREGGLTPTLIIEILSPSTESRDRVEKMQIYRDIFKTPDYALLQAETGGIEFYHLENGAYVRVHADRNGRFRCSSLPLLLGTLNGQPVWFERDGTVLAPITEQTRMERERADAEHLRAEAERDRAERAEARAGEAEARAGEAEARARGAEARIDEVQAKAERLAARLRELGLDDT